MRATAGAWLGGIALVIAGFIAGRQLLEAGNNGSARVIAVRQTAEPGPGPGGQGYLVTYRLRGREGTVRLGYHPGNSLPVQDGDIVINDRPIIVVER